MRYSKGVMWLDDCRIPFVDDVDLDKKLPKQDGGTIYGGGKGFYRTDETSEYKTGGRFTPNLLVCDDMLNDGNIYKSGDGKSGMKLINHNVNNFAVGEDCSFHKESKTIHYGDKGTNSRFYDLDKWFDKVIDEIQ
jgi:hypothetical protein